MTSHRDWIDKLNSRPKPEPPPLVSRQHPQQHTDDGGGIAINRKQHSKQMDEGRLSIPASPITMVPGTYTTRSGQRVQITEKDGQYYVGYRQTQSGRKQWRWFPNGETYDNDKWNDIVAT